MILDKFIKMILKFINHNSATISVLISLLALGVGLFNTYQIKNEEVIFNSSRGKIESPEKIVNNLPPNAPFLGNPDAKLTVVEFGDFQCPFCGRFRNTTFPILKEKYIDTGKINFIYVDLAFLGQESKDAAEAAKCAYEQGKFWEYHDELYKNQKGKNSGAFSEINLKKFAKDLNLNMSQFEICITDNKYDEYIEDEANLARRFGADVTPSLFIGKKILKGSPPIAYIEEIIEGQLK